MDLCFALYGKTLRQAIDSKDSPQQAIKLTDEMDASIKALKQAIMSAPALGLTEYKEKNLFICMCARAGALQRGYWPRKTVQFIVQ